jgi:hypothetical protein
MIRHPDQRKMMDSGFSSTGSPTIAGMTVIGDDTQQYL